jgi:hypothetical protein
MKEKLFGNQKFLFTLLILQVIPLLLYPPSSFELTSQTWWLPAVLVLMALIGSIQLFRRSRVPWSIYLIAFSHGFNIISRLLMLMPGSTAGTSTDGLYFILSTLALILSTLMLWILEMPRVRQVLIG